MHAILGLSLGQGLERLCSCGILVPVESSRQVSNIVATHGECGETVKYSDYELHYALELRTTGWLV